MRVGDDAVAIKSGIDWAGRRFGRPSADMLFRRNTFVGRRFAMGSEMSGGIYNITLRDSTLGHPSLTPGHVPSVNLGGASSGVYIKSERGRGGTVAGILVLNVTLLGPTHTPFLFDLHYSDARRPTNASATPRIADVRLRDVLVVNASSSAKPGWAGSFVGLPEAPIEGLELANVTVVAGDSAGHKPSNEAWDCNSVGPIKATDCKPPLPKACW